MSAIRKFALSIFFLAAAVAGAHGQMTVSAVAAVAGQPSGYTTITGQDNTSNPYVYASGYFQPSDGGGGYFTRVPGSCYQSVGATVNGATVTISLALPFALTRGMGIGGTGTSIPAGDTVDSFATNAATNVTTIWLSQAAGTYSGTITIDGGSAVDGGSKVADNAGNCFKRTSAFTGNVREWGASCDVQMLQGSVTWNASSAYLSVPTAPQPTPGEFIALSEIGSVPIHATSASTLANAGSGWAVGDVVTFDASGTVKTQEVGIRVDSISGGGSTGPIATWHFVWGGQYSSVPVLILGSNRVATALMQDQTNGGGTGAQFQPVWSGWTVINVFSSGGGSNYAVGDSVTFTGTGEVYNQNQRVQIIVDQVDSSASNKILAFHFANPGSYYTLPNPSGTSPGRMTQYSTSGTGSGATLTPNWSQGTVATTVASVMGGQVFVSDPSTIITNYNESVLVGYFGHDDGVAINNALANSPGGADVILPANCGTTQQITLPANSSSVNAALRGLSTSSSGIYAFGSPGITPMNHVVYRGPKGGAGSGMKDMVVEGLGITQGVGTGAVGTILSQNGSVVEIDSGFAMHFDNIWVKDGFGSGNADFQCAPQDADPDGMVYKDKPGPIWVLNSRLDTPNPLSGAYSPDFGLEAAGCHDSYFTNIGSFNATVANIRLDQNHLLSPHVFSNGYPPFESKPGAAESQPTYPGYPGVLGYPGVASWGIWVTGHAWITDVQCDVASRACIFQDTNPNSQEDAPSNIFGLKMDCGPATGVPAGYYGVEFGAGAVNVNLMGVGGKGSCNIPPSQLIHFDSTPDPSLQVFGNSVYPFAQFTLPAFTQPQGRLSLSATQSVMTSDVDAATTIYYLPYVGANLPVWNGQMYAPLGIGASGLSLGLSGAQVMGNLYDVYAGIKPDGTLALCTGPAWTNTGTRSSAIENSEGVWVNAAGMTCTLSSGRHFTCATLFCTYLGTMYATADGTTAMQFGPDSGVGGPCTATGYGNFLGLWNAYNRVHAFSVARDSNAHWTQSTASAWEPADPGATGGGACNRITFVDGLAQSSINPVETQPIEGFASTNQPKVGVLMDSVASAPAAPAIQENTAIGSVAYSNWSAPLLGLHYAQAAEYATSTMLTFYQAGLSLQLNWEY